MSSVGWPRARSRIAATRAPVTPGSAVADRRASPKGTSAAAIGQQFARYTASKDRSEAEAIGQRTRRHLCFVEIGRHRRRIEMNSTAWPVDELVEEYDVILDAEFPTRVIRLAMEPSEPDWGGSRQHDRPRWASRGSRAWRRSCLNALAGSNQTPEWTERSLNPSLAFAAPARKRKSGEFDFVVRRRCHITIILEDTSAMRPIIAR